MDYITLTTLQKLKEAGFSYPEYEHFLNSGMLYHYQGDEYLIGGFAGGQFTRQDVEAARYGIWLPEASQLLSWLTHTGFRVTITNEPEPFYQVQATDTVTGSVYDGKDLTLANALAVTIRKICKSAQRPYIPAPSLRLPIVD